LFMLLSIAICTKIENKIDSREFQEIIDDFVEIHKIATSDIDISMLLTNIKLTLDANQKSYRSFLDGFIVTCNNAKFKLFNYVETLKGAADETKRSANNWKQSADKAYKDSAQNNKMLNQTKETLSKVLEDMAQIIVDYHKGVSESDAKLIVLKQLFDIIEDELLTPSGKSFVQLKFHKSLESLQELVMRSHDTLYTPILSTLITLATEQNFSNQNVLKQILLNLRKLKMNIEKFKAEKEMAMNDQMRILKQEEENLESQIGDYQHLSERYVSIVVEAHQNMALLNRDFTNFQSEIARKNSELETVNHLCEEEDTMYKKGINRISLIKEGISEALHLDQQMK